MADGDWNAYYNYNNTLRAWFVAFGIGAPATFLINEDLIKYITPETGNVSIVEFFVFGAAAQVLMAFINKTINWCHYYKLSTFENNPVGLWQMIPNHISKIHNWYIIDFTFDLITMFCFSVAIVLLFQGITH